LKPAPQWGWLFLLPFVGDDEIAERKSVVNHGKKIKNIEKTRLL
jgi:hypothetical protein